MAQHEAVSLLRPGHGQLAPPAVLSWAQLARRAPCTCPLFIRQGSSDTFWECTYVGIWGSQNYLRLWSNGKLCSCERGSGSRPFRPHLCLVFFGRLFGHHGPVSYLSHQQQRLRRRQRPLQRGHAQRACCPGFEGLLQLAGTGSCWLPLPGGGW